MPNGTKTRQFKYGAIWHGLPTGKRNRVLDWGDGMEHFRRVFLKGKMIDLPTIKRNQKAARSSFTWPVLLFSLLKTAAFPNPSHPPSQGACPPSAARFFSLSLLDFRSDYLWVALSRCLIFVPFQAVRKKSGRKKNSETIFLVDTRG